MQEERTYGHQLKKKPRLDLGFGDIIMKPVRMFKYLASVLIDGKRVAKQRTFKELSKEEFQKLKNALINGKLLLETKFSGLLPYIHTLIWTRNVGQSPHEGGKSLGSQDTEVSLSRSA